WHCCVLENASGISACITNDDSASNIRRFGVNAGQLHRCRVRKGLVTVVALDENWSVSRDWVHECFSWKLLFRPFSFIPSTAQDLFAVELLFCLGRDAFCDLLWSCHVSKLNLI